jgi:uncharacterized protein (DUF427 family)
MSITISIKHDFFLRTSIDFSQQKSLLHSELLPGIASSSRAAASWKRTSAYWRTTAAGIDRLNETWGYPMGMTT